MNRETCHAVDFRLLWKRMLRLIKTQILKGKSTQFLLESTVPSIYTKEVVKWGLLRPTSQTYPVSGYAVKYCGSVGYATLSVVDTPVAPVALVNGNQAPEIHLPVTNRAIPKT
jgi:hypothetical protein